MNPGGQLYAVSVDPTQRFVYTAEQGTKKDQHLRHCGRWHAARAASSSTTIAGRPTSLTLAAQGRFAYVASSDEDKGIYAFSVDATSGALTAAGDPMQLAQASPAYLAAEPTGHFLYVTQNGVFGIRGYSINQTSGALSELETSPYGSTQVFAGAIAFHPGGGFLFTSGAGLNAFAIDATTGALTLVDGSPFSTEVSSDPSASNLTVEPRGKYLYVTSFLNPPRVFGFAIDSSNGKLTAVPGEPIKGGSPYSLGVEPSGRFVFAGNDDGTTSVFSLQRTNGTLRETRRLTVSDRRLATGARLRDRPLAGRLAVLRGQKLLDQLGGVAAQLLEHHTHARWVGLDAHDLTDALDRLDTANHDGESQIHLRPHGQRRAGFDERPRARNVRHVLFDELIERLELFVDREPLGFARVRHRS